MIAPQISIIVPVYKVEPYLRKCVDSILAQTYTNIEVILVDDGSPDGCPAICDEYAAKDRRVVVIHQRNAGVSAARNAGLDAAKGVYLAFVDSDDWIEPDMYEVLYKVIKASGADVAASTCCGGEDRPARIDADEYAVYSPKAAVGKFLYGQCGMLAVWGKLYARGCVERLRFEPTLRVAEDICFEAQVLVSVKTVAYVDYASYHYVVRADSATHVYDERMWTIFRAIDRVVEVVRAFDGDSGKCAETQVITLDVECAKEAEAVGRLSDEAFRKFIAHLREYLTRETWKPQPLMVKCWLCLLLLGRRPFLIGRKTFRGMAELRRLWLGGLCKVQGFGSRRFIRAISDELAKTD